MDNTQEQHERAVGDAFTAWFNQENGTSYEFHARGADPPDLIYRFGTRELLLEVTGAYYDSGQATMLWKNAREVADTPDSWTSSGPDQKLVDSVSLALAKKSSKASPPGAVLIVVIYPDLTGADEFPDLMPSIHVPTDHSFAEIYVGGMFPSSSSGSAGGYSWWRLSPPVPSRTSQAGGPTGSS